MSVEGEKKTDQTTMGEALSRIAEDIVRAAELPRDGDAQADPAPAAKKPQGPIPITPGKELQFLSDQLRELTELAADLRPPIPSNLGKLDMIHVLRGRLVTVKSTAFAQGQTLATAAQLCRDEKITLDQYAEHVGKVRALFR